VWRITPLVRMIGDVPLCVPDAPKPSIRALEPEFDSQPPSFPTSANSIAVALLLSYILAPRNDLQPITYHTTDNARPKLRPQVLIVLSPKMGLPPINVASITTK
jgi:hypothetical protein